MGPLILPVSDRLNDASGKIPRLIKGVSNDIATHSLAESSLFCSLRFAFDKKVALPLLGVTAVVLLAGLLALNWKSLRLKMIHYEKGTVVVLQGHPEPYGQITGYESMHRFPAGNPSAAYEMKLDGRETTVWVSERLVVNGMQPLLAK